MAVQRADSPPPPLHTKKWSMQFKLFFFYNYTYINDAR